MAATHVIADLHLVDDRDPNARRLAGYLAGPARDAAALYVLGDLFDVWIGDDGSMPEHAATLDAFGELVAAGVPAYFIRGNRDFAVGAAFVARSGLQIIDDPSRVTLHGVPTLLAHGDVFCTGDPAHQAFRAKYTDPRWRAKRLALPLWLRGAAARRARRRSTQRKAGQPLTVMDVDPTTVARMATSYDVQRIVHGHTHRPADHANGPIIRHVVADWRPNQTEVLCIDATGVTRRQLAKHGEFIPL